MRQRLPRLSAGHLGTTPALLRGRFASETEGGALVEMAVTLPLILLLMTGIFTFSIALYQKMALAEAVSAGGRALSVGRGDSDACATAGTAIYAAAPGLDSSKMTLAFVITPNGGSATTYSSASCSGITTLGTKEGGTAALTVSYPCSLSIFGKSISSCTLSSSITEVIQ
jgi:Flp pilus assembly protein TadG